MGLDRLRTEKLCSVGESMFVPRRCGEVDYLKCLRALPAEPLEAWRRAAWVDPAACI